MVEGCIRFEQLLARACRPPSANVAAGFYGILENCIASHSIRNSIELPETYGKHLFVSSIMVWELIFEGSQML